MGSFILESVWLLGTWILGVRLRVDVGLGVEGSGLSMPRSQGRQR